MNSQVIFGNQQDSESGLKLSSPITDLIKTYQDGIKNRHRGKEAPIHVDEVASKIATLYEKIRKVVDWKEENVLRRSAIIRVLKRSFIGKISEINILPQANVDLIAERLTLELIRGGHLPNDEIPAAKINTVSEILSKYIYLLEKAPFRQNDNSFILKKKVNFYEWLLEIAACEIEEVLANPFKENGLIKAMTILMSERIKLVPENGLTEEDKKTLTYIAVCRTLFDLDDAFISYHILTHQYHDWEKPSEVALAAITKNIFKINEDIEGYLTHPLSHDFFNICERIDTVFTLIGDLLDKYEKDPEKINQIISNKTKFRDALQEFYDARIKSLKKRLFRLAIFSTLSVFLSNWVTFVLVEVPLASIFYEGFNLLAAATDFLVPSLAMFTLVSIIKPPAKSNFQKVIEITFKFVYDEGTEDLYEIRTVKRKRRIFSAITAFLYILGCFISFGLIAFAFYKAQIPITSVIFDTLTLTLNIFAALVIRNKAKELTVEEKSGILQFVLDFLSIPIAQIGNYLANKWKEYNIVAVFFNYFIELPFVSFVEFIDNWSQFLKEKKADIH